MHLLGRSPGAADRPETCSPPAGDPQPGPGGRIRAPLNGPPAPARRQSTATSWRQDHDLRIFGRLTAAQQHQPAEDPDRDQVEQAKEHNPRSCRNRLIQPNRRSQRLRRILKRYRCPEGDISLAGPLPPTLSCCPYEQELSAMEALVRTLRTIRLAAAATIAAAAVSAALALPAHAEISGIDYGSGTTLAAAEQDALQTLHGDYGGCVGPPHYYDILGGPGDYMVTVSENCQREN